MIKFMKNLSGVLAVAMMMSFAVVSVSAQSPSDTTTLVAGLSSGSINSSAAFTSGANSTVNGYVIAVGAVNLGANSLVTGNVTSGAAFICGDSARIQGSVSAMAAFTSGANSVITGNVYVSGDITLGAGSRILGFVHSGTGVINYGAGATVGSIQ